VNNNYYIDSKQLGIFLNRLNDNFRVFVPAVKEEEGSKEPDYFYKNLSDNQDLVFNPYRSVEPLKSFFTSPQERISTYFTAKSIIETPAKTVIFGLKNCDLVGHKIQDFVFLEGVEKDTLYRLKRENTIFISGDCTDFKEVCHCLAWNIMPYPKEGFDINISPLNDGFLLEVGSEKGWQLIQQFKEYFILAKEAQIATRRLKRESLVERLKNHLDPQNLVPKDKVQEIVKSGYDADTWQQFMLTCVECGGCNLICDTCHCFLIDDVKEKNQNAKVRVWDSCLYANYARVAGGANPLKLRKQRLRNRFMKKFDFFVENLGMPACCGCGRCIEVCPGKIDIREVLKDLAKKAGSKQ